MESSGTLIARVYTSRAQIPISNATVAVTQKGTDGKHILIAVRISDESGNTEPVTIPTPNPSQSVSPGGTAPFALCDLWVESPGFEHLRAENVQIFPGVSTVQALELIPLPEYTPFQSRSEVIQITPQDL